MGRSVASQYLSDLSSGDITGAAVLADETTDSDVVAAYAQAKHITDAQVTDQDSWGDGDGNFSGPGYSTSVDGGMGAAWDVSFELNGVAHTDQITVVKHAGAWIVDQGLTVDLQPELDVLATAHLAGTKASLNRMTGLPFGVYNIVAPPGVVFDPSILTIDSTTADPFTEVNISQG
ncbi:hypothetical protein [Subtercola endophyticus]|uniref:hypothetical protein n=1 Tax=Subtercola endophyticus TaxID=2895559 RepID=UPI001E5F22DA|nr:hypothetical protein [Subtercola endophyticus]UFS60348.1 hypothetical protein LQ955_06255 [Subtercola endophyticus]